MRTLFWILLAAHYGYLEPGYLTDSSALMFVIWMFVIADFFFFSISSYGKFRNELSKNLAARRQRDLDGIKEALNGDKK